MPVTEFATFKLKEPYSLDSEELRTQFHKLSSWQSEWSKYPLTFYNSTNDPSLVYLLSGWEDVSAHMKWIESEGNQTLLKIFDPILSIVDFAHLGIDFTEIPPDTQLLVYHENVARDVKETSNICGPTSFEGHDVEGGLGIKLWSGHGQAVEKPTEYCFTAYRDIDVKLGEESKFRQWKIMRRIYF